MNPVQEISEVTHAAGRKLLIDSMSAFGAVPLEVADIRYEAMVSSTNKCIEGVLGFGFVIARKSELEADKGNSHSLALDVHAQWAHMNKTGQWLFTPPTHLVAAFLEALTQHEVEGGVKGRGARYTRNRDVIVAGVRELRFETLLKGRWQSPIIVTFFCPADPGFMFDRFYQLMKDKGFIFYPGKLTVVDSFRIGCIGQMDKHVMFAEFVPAQLACLPKYTALLPGVKKAANGLPAQGIKMGVSTGFTRVMVDELLKDVVAQGVVPDGTVAGDEVVNGARPAPHMVFKNLDLLNISDVRSVVKCDDTVSGVGEAMNAGCWGVGLVRFSNYMNINTLEEEATLNEADIAARMAKTRKILEQADAHYVIDSLVELPAVIDDINARLARGEKP